MEINDLLSLTADELATWIKSNLDDEKLKSSGFNWHGLADALAFDCRQPSRIKEKLRLAELAVTIYERLADYDNAHADSYRHSANLTRVNVLFEQLVGLDDPILGIDNMTQRLFEGVEISAQDAAKLASVIKEKLADDNAQISENEFNWLKKLRIMKTRLYPISELSTKFDLNLNEAVCGWLKIRDSLP